MNARTDCDKQADDFLTRTGIRFRATMSSRQIPPPWCDASDHIHGDKYTVTLSKPGNGRLSFSFWNSLDAMQKGKDLRPHAVLSCISSDACCPETFEDFCAEYGYDQDSRKAWATFKRCDAFRERLQRFFTEQEIEALGQIQ
jgi:hypothetical protein